MSALPGLEEKGASIFPTARRRGPQYVVANAASNGAEELKPTAQKHPRARVACVIIWPTAKAVGKDAAVRRVEPRKGRHPIKVRTRLNVAHTYTNILIHALFSTKDRQPWLDAEVKAEMFPYQGGVINELGGQSLLVNGPSDHVHMLFSRRRSRSRTSWKRRRRIPRVG